MRCAECGESGHFKCTSIEESLRLRIDFSCTVPTLKPRSVSSKSRKDLAINSNVMLDNEFSELDESHLGPKIGKGRED
jgi:hypothetical protein